MCLLLWLLSLLSLLRALTSLRRPDGGDDAYEMSRACFPTKSNAFVIAERTKLTQHRDARSPFAALGRHLLHEKASAVGPGQTTPAKSIIYACSAMLLHCLKVSPLPSLSTMNSQA